MVKLWQKLLRPVLVLFIKEKITLGGFPEVHFYKLSIHLGSI